MCVYDCQACGLATERSSVDEFATVEHVQDGVVSTCEAPFPACVACASIDVDVYSEEGWQIEMRAREVMERGFAA